MVVFRTVIKSILHRYRAWNPTFFLLVIQIKSWDSFKHLAWKQNFSDQIDFSEWQRYPDLAMTVRRTLHNWQSPRILQLRPPQSWRRIWNIWQANSPSARKKCIDRSGTRAQKIWVETRFVAMMSIPARCDLHQSFDSKRCAHLISFHTRLAYHFLRINPCRVLKMTHDKNAVDFSALLVVVWPATSRVALWLSIRARAMNLITTSNFARILLISFTISFAVHRYSALLGRLSYWSAFAVHKHSPYMKRIHLTLPCLAGFGQPFKSLKSADLTLARDCESVSTGEPEGRCRAHDQARQIPPLRL